MTNESKKKADSTAELATTPQGGALELYDYSKFEGDGFDGADAAADLVKPFIEVLQTNSKACDPGEAKYVPGAKAGMFLNTATRELIPGDTGFAMVPIRIEHCVVVWTSSRQFVRRVPINDPEFLAAKKRFEASTDPKKRMSKDIKDDDGNQMVETYYIWALILDEDGETPIGGVVLPMKSTNIAMYRKQVYTPLYTFKLPGGPKLFVHRQRCTLAAEKRPDGNSYNYRFSPLKGTIKDSLIPPTSPLMAEVHELHQMIAAGQVKMSEESDDARSSGGGAAEPDPFA